MLISSVYNLIKSVRCLSRPCGEARQKYAECMLYHAANYNHPRVCQKICHGSVYFSMASY